LKNLGPGRFAVQGGETQPPMSPQEYKDLRRGPGAGGEDPPLAAATLDRGSPNFTRADKTRIFGVCEVNRGGAIEWMLPLASI